MPDLRPLLLFTCCLLPSALVAAEDPPPPTEETEAEEQLDAGDVGSSFGDIGDLIGQLDQALLELERALPRTHVGVSVGGVGAAPVADGDEEIAIGEFSAHAFHLFHIEAAGGFGMAVNASSRQFDADEPIDLPESGVSVGTGLVGWRRVGRRLHLVGLAHVGLRGEPDALDDGFRAAAGVGVVWRPGGGWTVIGGLGVATAIDGVVPVPIIAAIWSGERWTVNLIPIAPSASYRIDERWRMSFGLKPVAGEYQLADDPAGESLVYRDFRIYTGASYTAERLWSLEAEIGVAVGRRFEWYRDGDRHRDIEVDPAGYLRLGAGLRW